MKLMYFDDFRLGVVKGDAVVDVTKAVQDIPHKRIEYQDAYLDMFGVPVMYFPYFSSPDPSVHRQSGFLMGTLKYGWGSILAGARVEQHARRTKGEPRRGRRRIGRTPRLHEATECLDVAEITGLGECPI